jgi:hypothetical protein
MKGILAVMWAVFDNYDRTSRVERLESVLISASIRIRTADGADMTLCQYGEHDLFLTEKDALEEAWRRGIIARDHLQAHVHEISARIAEVSKMTIPGLPSPAPDAVI